MWSSRIAAGATPERRRRRPACTPHREQLVEVRVRVRSRGISRSQSPTRSNRTIARSRRAAAEPRGAAARSRTILAAAARPVDLERPLAPRLLGVEEGELDRGARRGPRQRRAPSSSTTATPEAPSLAPTKPGMSLVSWWAPTTRSPGSLPRDRRRRRCGGAAGRDLAHPASRSAGDQLGPPGGSPPSRPAGGRSRPALADRGRRARRRSAPARGVSEPSSSSAAARAGPEHRGREPAEACASARGYTASGDASR